MYFLRFISHAIFHVADIGMQIQDRGMSLPRTNLHAQRVPKRKASNYADQLFEAQRGALAKTLVHLRLARGLSQESLAYEAEVERSYLSLIERGQGNPSLRVLCQLAQRLGVPVIEVLGQPNAVTDTSCSTTRG